MNNDYIKCICGNEFKNKEFKKHFKKCNSFIKKFNKFDLKISLLLDEYLYNKENLFLIRFLFKKYLKKIDKKIVEYINNKYSNSYPKERYINSNSFKNKIEINTPGNNSKIINYNLDKNIKFMMKEENLMNDSHIFNDFVNIDIYEENPSTTKNQTNTPNPSDDYIRNPSQTNIQNPSQSFTPDPSQNETPNPSQEQLLKQSGFVKEFKKYFNNENDNGMNNNKKLNENNKKNNNDKLSNKDNNFANFFMQAGKNYINSFFTSNIEINQERYNSGEHK